VGHSGHPGPVLHAWERTDSRRVINATNGGISAGFEEVWSGAGRPYLQARPDGPSAIAQRFRPSLCSDACLPRTPEARARSALWRPTSPVSAGNRLTGAQIGHEFKLQRRPQHWHPPAAQSLGAGRAGGWWHWPSRAKRRGAGSALDAIRRTFRNCPSNPVRAGSLMGAGAWRIVGGGFGMGPVVPGWSHRSWRHGAGPDAHPRALLPRATESKRRLQAPLAVTSELTPPPSTRPRIQALGRARS